ncbi:MAG: NAD(P)H-dependent oxidoreductase [Acidimicrobiia bacterium]
MTVYAHQNPRSFCHGVLEQFTAGLTDGGHTSEVVDLYAIAFDPVFRDRDVASYTAGDIPADVLELMDLRQQVLDSCRGPRQRFLASRAMRAKSDSEIALESGHIVATEFITESPTLGIARCVSPNGSSQNAAKEGGGHSGSSRGRRSTSLPSSTTREWTARTADLVGAMNARC